MRRRLRGQEAATTSEYVGVVAVVVVLVGALIVNNPVGLGQTIQSSIQAAFCRIMTAVDSGPCAPGGGDPAEVDDAVYRPDPCVVSSRERDTQGTIEALFFEVGRDRGFLWEEKSDGSVELTLLVKARGGVAAEVGGEGGITYEGVDYGVEASAEADAVMAAETGKTWVFEGPDGVEHAEQVVDWIQREHAEDNSTTPIQTINTAVEHITGEPDPPVHTREFVAGGVAASTKAGATGLGLAAEIGVQSVIMIGTDYTVNAAGRHTRERDEYYEVSLGGGVAGSVGPFGIGAAGDKEVAVILSYDRDDEPVDLTIVDTTMGAIDRNFLDIDGDVAEEGFRRLASLVESGEATGTAADENTTVITSRLALTTPEEQRLATEWVDTFANPREIDAMMREEGRISVVSYEGHTTGLGLKAKLAAGAKIGVEFGQQRTNATAVEALYLGGPGDSGRREMQPFTECVPDHP